MIHIAADGSGLARPLAGVGSYTRQLVRAMATHRPDARITVYGPAGAGSDVAASALRPLPALPLIGRHVQFPLAVRRSGARLYLGCAGQLPLGGVGMPSAVTAHDMAIYRHPEWFPSGQWLSVRLVVPRSMRRADAVLAVSTNTAREVAQLFDVPEERIHVVPLGADSACRPLPASDLDEVRRRLRLPERFILFLSTIEPRKNLDTLLGAWDALGRNPDLVVAGGWGWHADAMRRRLDGAGDGVRVLGPVAPSDLPAVLNLATCLAHPAWYEGFGLPPLEAMACGTPVVVSNAPALPEVVGDAGIFVDPGDVEGWAEALRRALEDDELRRELRARGLRRAAQLTWGRTAAETWQVIDELIGPAPASPA